MEQASTIGLDLAKHILQVHGADASGRVVFRKRLARAKVVQFFGIPKKHSRRRGGLLQDVSE
jgi:hypothetical protein